MRTITLPNNETVTLREFLDRYKFIKSQGFKYKCNYWFGFSAHRGLVVMWMHWWVNKKINDRGGQDWVEPRDRIEHFIHDLELISTFYSIGEPVKVFASQLCQKRLGHMLESNIQVWEKALRIATIYGMGCERFKQAAKGYSPTDEIVRKRIDERVKLFRPAMTMRTASDGFHISNLPKYGSPNKTYPKGVKFGNEFAMFNTGSEKMELLETPERETIVLQGDYTELDENNLVRSKEEVLTAHETLREALKALYAYESIGDALIFKDK